MVLEVWNVPWCEYYPVSCIKMRFGFILDRCAGTFVLKPFCIQPGLERGGGCVRIVSRHPVCSPEGVPGITDWHGLHKINRTTKTHGYRAVKICGESKGEWKSPTICFTLTVVTEGIPVPCRS